MGHHVTHAEHNVGRVNFNVIHVEHNVGHVEQNVAYVEINSPKYTPIYQQLIQMGSNL